MRSPLPLESLLVLLVIRVLVGVVQVHRPMPLVNFLCSLEGLEDVEDVLDAVRLDSQKLELLLVSHTQLSDEIIHLLLLCQLKEDPVSVCSLSEAIQKLGLLSLFPCTSLSNCRAISSSSTSSILSIRLWRTLASEQLGRLVTIFQ